jgi:hypothetical protein
MAGQQQAQQNQLAQQQLLANKQQMETGALQQQKAQLELANYKTKQEGLDKFVELSAANGKTGSPKELASSFYDFALAQRDPQLIMSAQTMLQAANERERYQGYLKSQQTIPAQQAPAPMAGGLGSGTFGMDNLPGMPNAFAQRAAAPIESTNALATQAANPVAALETKIAQLRTFRDPDAKFEADRLQKQVDEYNKVHVVGGSLLKGTGDVVGTAPITPYQKLQNEIAQGQLGVSQGQLEVSRGQLGVSRGQLKVAQDRLAREGAALDPAENAAISKAIIEGRVDPTKVNGRNAKIIANTLLSDPTVNIKELGIEAAGAGAGSRALGTQSAKILTASNEAGQMVDVVRDYSSKVNRTQYPTINSIQNAVDKGTGGAEIVKLNTAINALVNSYARAINPNGVATVSDKNHAREIINSNYANGQINAILDVMGQEMDIAKTSPGEAAKQLKAGRTGAAPAASQGTGGFKYLGKE